MLHSSTNPFLWNIDDQNYHGGYHGLNNNPNNDINEKNINNLTHNNTTNPPQPQEKHQHQQKYEKHPQADKSNAPTSFNNNNENISENNHIDEEVDVDVQKTQNGIKTPSPPSANGPINLSPKNVPLTATTTTAAIAPIQNTSSLSLNNNNSINNKNNNDYLNDKMHPIDLSGSSGSSSAVDPAPALDHTLSHLSGVLTQLKAIERR